MTCLQAFGIKWPCVITNLLAFIHVLLYQLPSDYAKYIRNDHCLALAL